MRNDTITVSISDMDTQSLSTIAPTLPATWSGMPEVIRRAWGHLLASLTRLGDSQRRTYLDWRRGAGDWSSDPQEITRVRLCQSCGATETPLHVHLYHDPERAQPLRRTRVCAACCADLGPTGCLLAAQQPRETNPWRRAWRILTLKVGDLGPQGASTAPGGWRDLHLISIVGCIVVIVISLWLVLHK